MRWEEKLPSNASLLLSLFAMLLCNARSAAAARGRGERGRRGNVWQLICGVGGSGSKVHWPPIWLHAEHRSGNLGGERLVDMNISNRMHPTKICYHCKIFYLRNHEMAMPPEPPVRCPPPPVGCTFNGESCQCLLRRVGRRRKREGGRKVE